MAALFPDTRPVHRRFDLRAVDFEKGVEFLLTAVVLINDNGIFNDGVYEYDEVGFPFLAELGRVIYEYELKRQRAHRPDLSKWQLDSGP